VNKNAFVTGACGFIGSNLVKELLSRNWNVIGITKKIPINYLSHNNLKIIEGDILYREQLLGLRKV
jgi:nucleoside-diphosphate-sugar epimerase